MSRAGGGREPGRGACARRWVRGGRGACMRQALGPGTGGLRARACASGPGSGVQHSAAPPGWADRLAGCDWVVWVLEGGVGACWQDVLCVTHACPGGSDLGRRRGHKACGGNSSEAGALTCCVHAYGASCVQDHHNEGHCGRHAEHRLSAPASGGCLCRRPRTHPPTTASPRPGTAAGAGTNFRLYFIARGVANWTCDSLQCICVLARQPGMARCQGFTAAHQMRSVPTCWLLTFPCRLPALALLLPILGTLFA